MKKTTSIFGKLSLVVIILFVAATANAKKPKSVVAVFGKQMSMGVYNPVNANEWRIVVTQQQKLSIKQVAGQALTADVVIKNSRGEAICTGTLKDGTGSIDISKMEYGKYGVYIQNKDAEKIYKLLIE